MRQPARETSWLLHGTEQTEPRKPPGVAGKVGGLLRNSAIVLQHLREGLMSAAMQQRPCIALGASRVVREVGWPLHVDAVLL